MVYAPLFECFNLSLISVFYSIEINWYINSYQNGICVTSILTFNVVVCHIKTPTEFFMFDNKVIIFVLLIRYVK